MFLVKAQAWWMKKFRPESAIGSYCLKSNPNARLFLPGKDIELAVINKAGSEQVQRQFVALRVWSSETRLALFERRWWDELGVESTDEFEFLLKKLTSEIYMTSGRSIKKHPAFAAIRKAVAENQAFISYLMEMYANVVFAAGASVWAEALSAEAYEHLCEGLAGKDKKNEASFAAKLNPQSPAFEKIFMSVWREGGELLPMMDSLWHERRDLYQMMRERAKALPTLSVLSAAFRYFLRTLEPIGEHPEEERAFDSWLATLMKRFEAIAASDDSGAEDDNGAIPAVQAKAVLAMIAQRLQEKRYPQLWGSVQRLAKLYAPSALPFSALTMKPAAGGQGKPKSGANGSGRPKPATNAQGNPKPGGKGVYKPKPATKGAAGVKPKSGANGQGKPNSAKNGQGKPKPAVNAQGKPNSAKNGGGKAQACANGQNSPKAQAAANGEGKPKLPSNGGGRDGLSG